MNTNTIALTKNLVIAMEEAIASIDAGMHLGASVTLGEALWKNRAAIAALEAEPQDDEPTWQELEDFRKRHWTHWNAADNLLIAHLAQKLKCAARAKE